MLRSFRQERMTGLLRRQGLDTQVQRRELLSGQKRRGLGGAVRQMAVAFQTREVLARGR